MVFDFDFGTKIRVRFGDNDSKYRHNKKIFKKPASHKKLDKVTFRGFFDYLKNYPQIVSLLFYTINNHHLLIAIVIIFYITIHFK